MRQHQSRQVHAVARDLRADWQRWSTAERVTALVILTGTVLSVPSLLLRILGH